ncbi:MAG: hypothetical protein ACLFWB_02030 [Armatimonadota bacterium]
MKRFLIVFTIMSMSVAVALSEPVYYQAADGSWASMDAPVEDGRLKIHITPESAPNGEALLVINKPEWMVLDDTEPPQLNGLKVNGNARPVSLPSLHLGTLGGETAEVIVAASDAKNPLSPDSLRFELYDRPDVDIQIDPGDIGPPNKSARLVVNISGLTPGAYEGLFSVSDLAPLTNILQKPIRFNIFGVSVADDKQTVTLANEATEYVLQPDKSEQLKLPNGLWAKLTSNVPGNFLYPLSFTDVQITKDAADGKTVLVTADCQNLDEEPVEGVLKIEYELTVRPDTAALQVVTRSINISDKKQSIGPNWGWLNCPYYVTPEGRGEWSSGKDNKYSDIGKVDWLWLAPRNEQNPGLLWVSPDRFGEFMGGSILLYGPRVDAKTDEYSEMRMFFAPAESAEKAEEIYNDLVEKGIYTPAQ